MTTSVLIHCQPQDRYRVKVECLDRQWYTARNALSDEWKETGEPYFVEPGHQMQTYCTDTRKLVITEVPLPEPKT